MNKIRAILFDMGGTLVKVESIPETYRRILKAYGIELPIEKVTMAWEEANKKLDVKRMPELGRSFWVEINLLVLKHLGIKCNVLPLAEAMDREWWDYAKTSLYPEMLTVLRELKEKQLKIGIITNSFQSDMKKILSKFNLEGFFDIEVSIDSIGKVKPEKEIFLYAVEKLGLQPKGVLYVGDSLEVDYKGAIEAGLNALLVDRENKMNQDIKKIRNLREILLLNIYNNAF